MPQPSHKPLHRRSADLGLRWQLSWVCAGVLACSGQTPTPSGAASEAARASAEVGDEPPAVSLGPLWAAASNLDPLYLSRLANAEGASGLLQGIAAGGTARRTALAAMPFAANAIETVGVLCESLATSDEPHPVLQALHAIFSEPALDRETPDADGLERCRRRLDALKVTELPVKTADLALSSRQMLREHLAAGRE